MFRARNQPDLLPHPHSWLRVLRDSQKDLAHVHSGTRSMQTLELWTLLLTSYTVPRRTFSSIPSHLKLLLCEINSNEQFAALSGTPVHKSHFNSCEATRKFPRFRFVYCSTQGLFDSKVRRMPFEIKLTTSPLKAGQILFQTEMQPTRWNCPRASSM